MTRDELNWLAGLLEGEGSFMKGPPSAPNTPSVSVHMTDLDVVERVTKLFGMGFILEPKKQRDHHKKSYLSRVRGQRAIDLMILLRPLMGERRKSQIDRALSSRTPVGRFVYPDNLLELREKMSWASLASMIGCTREAVRYQVAQRLKEAR